MVARSDPAAALSSRTGEPNWLFQAVSQSCVVQANLLQNSSRTRWISASRHQPSTSAEIALTVLAAASGVSCRIPTRLSSSKYGWAEGRNSQCLGFQNITVGKFAASVSRKVVALFVAMTNRLRLI